MFQNIVEEEKEEDVVIEENEFKEKINIKEIIKKLCTKQNILVYIISFMLSTISTVNGIAPFGLAIFAGALSNGLPAGVIFIITLIGTMIRYRNWSFTYIYINSISTCRNGINFQTMV